MSAPNRPGAVTPVQIVPRGAYLNLILAALGFLLTAWAWGLISPLSAHYKQALGLTSFQQSALVAVPVLLAAAAVEIWVSPHLLGLVAA